MASLLVAGLMFILSTIVAMVRRDACGYWMLGRPANGKKRTMSAAGRKRISAAQKARWAKVRKTRKAA